MLSHLLLLLFLGSLWFRVVAPTGVLFMGQIDLCMDSWVSGFLRLLGDPCLSYPYQMRHFDIKPETSNVWNVVNYLIYLDIWYNLFVPYKAFLHLKMLEL